MNETTKEAIDRLLGCKESAEYAFKMALTDSTARADLAERFINGNISAIEELAINYLLDEEADRQAILKGGK